MSRLADVFGRLAGEGRRALVTYLVAGDPTPETTLPAMHALADAGADVLELGVPFSDPEAEGPDIQAGCERALAHGTRLLDVLAMVRRFRERDDRTAVILMGYLNSVERMGYGTFADRAAEAGVDGLLMVNLPPEEAGPLREALRGRGLDLVLLLAPTTTEARARQILAVASGFAYYVSLKGTTGAGHLDVDDVRTRLDRLRAWTDLPLAVGFGIRDAASARAVAAFADGVVVGSAIVRAMGELAHTPERIPARLAELAAALREGVDGAVLTT